MLMHKPRTAERRSQQCKAAVYLGSEVGGTGTVLHQVQAQGVPWGFQNPRLCTCAGDAALMLAVISIYLGPGTVSSPLPQI